MKQLALACDWSVWIKFSYPAMYLHVLAFYIILYYIFIVPDPPPIYTPNNVHMHRAFSELMLDVSYNTVSTSCSKSRTACV